MATAAQSAASAVPSISRRYAIPGAQSACDEMVDAAGEMRPHWATFMRHLDALDSQALAERWQDARALIRENGVSFNVQGDPRGMERPWHLSPIPVLLAAGEFERLSRGLAQRARLLDRLLEDIYGPQRALIEGWLPPDLVLGHPGYLRPCAGVRPPDGRFVCFYAADVVRAPSGGWQVLTDRTQAPAGAGYALENRIVVSRVLPEPFRDCNVERLAFFFRTVRETLERLAPEGRENPRIVLLSPGPYSATAFEQAFLAQYLGYTLVEGADLAVRDGRVFLKTLGGLHRIDVILRRLNDDHCDPLELRPDSALGVPGLMQAVREGNVAVANALGSGVAQNPALMPFLPALARGLLGEELELPSVETFWCGDRAALSHVLANLGDMVVKPACPVGPTQPIFADELDAAARDQLGARIRAAPGRFVAQSRVTLSTTPRLEGDALEPRALVLRTFLVATAGDQAAGGYRAMPGGLALVAGAAGARDVSMQAGAGSKDAWVVGDAPVSAYTLLRPPGQPVELSRGGGDLPSRVADNLFWLGRYAERADAIARVARAASARLLEPPEGAAAGEIGLLVEALRVQTHTAAGGTTRVWPAGRSQEAVVASALFDEEHLGSLRSTVRSVYRVARAIRDRITLDSWRIVAALDEELRDADGGRENGGVGAMVSLSARLDRVISLSAALSGVVAESMTRGLAWRFLEMGRRLERAINIVLVLGATVTSASARDGTVLEALLEIADSGITYRRRYLASLQPAPVVDLLLADASNPRSAAFQLAALGDHLAVLPQDQTRTEPNVGAEVLRAAVAVVQAADLTAACAVDADGRRPALAALLAKLARELPAISDALSGSYLTHASLARHLRSWR